MSHSIAVVLMSYDRFSTSQRLHNFTSQSWNFSVEMEMPSSHMVLHLCPSVFLQLFVFVGLLFSYFTYLLHHEVIVISLYIMEDNKYLNFFSL